MHTRLCALASAFALSAGTAAATTPPAGTGLYWTEIGSLTSVGSLELGQQLGTPSATVQTVLTGNSSIRAANGLEAIAGRLWWPDQGRHAIVSSLGDGSDLRTIAANGVYDLDVEGNKAYWTANTANTISITTDLSGAAPTSSVLLSGLSRPFAIDVTGNYIYWSEVAGADRLMRSDLAGNNRVALLTGLQSYDFQVTDQYIYASTTAGDVIRSALDGSGRTTLASGLGLLTGIQVTDDTIYLAALHSTYCAPGFCTSGGGQVLAMGLGGQDPTVLYTATTGFVDTTPGSPFRADEVHGVAVLSPVPEPATAALWLMGLAGLAGCTRHRLAR